MDANRGPFGIVNVSLKQRNIIQNETKVSSKIIYNLNLRKLFNSKDFATGLAKKKSPYRFFRIIVGIMTKLTRVGKKFEAVPIADVFRTAVEFDGKETVRLPMIKNEPYAIVVNSAVESKNA